MAVTMIEQKSRMGCRKEEKEAYLLANVRVGAVEELFNVRSAVACQFCGCNVSNGSQCQTYHVLVDMTKVTMLQSVRGVNRVSRRREMKDSEEKLAGKFKIESHGPYNTTLDFKTYFLREFVTSINTSWRSSSSIMRPK